ncbi:hypothetical protein V8D89_014766 [Ganoderma adspersum]
MSFKVNNPPERLVETTPPPTKSKSDDHPETLSPSFHGNFDLYAMELPFIRSKFMLPERDYAALLKVLRYHQTRPDSSAQIYLPDSDDFSTGVPGRLRSLPIKDPLEGMPHRLALTSLELHESVSFTARETTEDALYSAPPPSTATPGVTATVSLVDHRCGAFMTVAMTDGEGTFEMRRAWVSVDGKDEIFEGFFSVDIGYASTCICGVIDDDDDDDVEALDVYMPFWGIRARVGPDGREVGLGTTGGDDENMEMRNLRLMLAGAGLKRAL